MLSRRLAAALTAVALAAVACGGDEGATSPPVASPTATETETPEPTVAPTETAATVDPTTVPDEITPEYVEAVMAELDRVEHEMLTAVRDTGEMGEEFQVDISSLWDAQYASSVADDYRNGLDPASVRDDATPVDTAVTEILSDSETCIDFQAEQDLSVLYTSEGLPTDETVTFIRLRAADPTQRNPTPWRYAYIGEVAPEGSCTS